MTFEVWYMKPNWFSQGISGKPPDASQLGETHIHLCNLYLEGGSSQLERVFHDMQAEQWSPNGEACDLIESKGLAHTSMSVGDIVRVDGEIHMVSNAGFKELV